MKKFLRVLPLLLLAAVYMQQPLRSEPPQKVSDLMRKKLTNSQKVLEGIALEDFNKIPGKFSDFSTSGLTYEVKSGPQTHDLELE